MKISSIGDFPRGGILDKLRAYFAERAGLCRTASVGDKNPLRILDYKVDANHPAVLAAPSSPMRSDQSAIISGKYAGLDLLSVRYETDSRLVRGLDYYTDIVFEFIYEGRRISRPCPWRRRYYAGLVAVRWTRDSRVGYAFELERIIIMEERPFPAA